MNRDVANLQRGFLSVAMTYLFFSVTLLLSLIPEVAVGPYGFEKPGVEASQLLRTLCQLMPLKGFAWAAPLVWWGTFRAIRDEPFDCLKVLLALLAILAGSGLLVLHALVGGFATWALEPPKPSLLRILSNIGLWITILLAVALQELGVRKRRAGV